MSLRVLLASIVLAGLGPAMAADGLVSTTPYATLYQVVSPVLSIGKYERLVAVERIESRVNARPEDIRIVIHAKSGAIAVPVAAGGIVKLPTSDALRDENPPVETNQPKGTLALIVNVALRGAEKLRVPWSDLEAGLDEVKAFYAESRGA